MNNLKQAQTKQTSNSLVEGGTTKTRQVLEDLEVANVNRKNRTY